MSLLLNTSTCILVNEDIDEVGLFFSRVFGCQKVSVSLKPIKHGVIEFISPSNEVSVSVILIDRKSVPLPLLESIESIAVKQITILVQDPITTQSLATEHGAQVTESNIDYDNANGTSSKNSVTFEGPDRIIFNVMGHSNKNRKGHEVFLSMIQSKLLDSDIADEFNSSPKVNGEQIEIPENPNSPSVKQMKPNRIYFPTLKVELLSNNKFIPCPPNPKFPIPFETDLFSGVAMLIIRTDPIDPLYKSFFNGKRLFECQMQGKFKRMPKGEYFVGAESVVKMEPGLIMRSIVKAVLQFFGSSIAGLQNSFGDAQTNPDFQYPHLVAGMFSSLDKLIITPPGQTPPVMGTPFIEDPENKKVRAKFKSILEANIDLESIYSFSVNSSNMDLINWSMTGIPLVRPFDMRPILGDSPIRLVGYELPKELADKNCNIHPQRSLNYLFAIRLTRVDSNDPVDMSFDENEIESDSDDPDDLRNTFANEAALAESSAGEPIVRQNSRRVVEDDEDGVEDEEDDVDSDDDQEPDGKASETKAAGADRKKGFFRDRKSVGGTVRSWFRRTPVPSYDIPETLEYSTVEHAFEVMGDLRYCPASVEVNEVRGDRTHRRVMYILPWNESLMSGSANQQSPLSLRLRTYSEVSKLLQMAPLPKLYKNKKFTEEEKKRRHIIETYRVALSKMEALAQSGTSKGVNSAVQSTPLVSLLNHNTPMDMNFLMKPPDVRYSGANTKSEQWEGCIATARASRHWIEKYLILTKTDAVMVKTAGRKRNRVTIPLVTILSVSPLPSDETPFPEMNFGFFQVETAARVHYFMVRNERLMKDWLIAFKQVLSDRVVKMECIDESTRRNQYSLMSKDFDEAYIAKPCDWKLEKRRIFNYRKILFSPNGIPAKFRNISPAKLVEGIMAKAFLLSEITEKTRPADPRLWVEFSDELSYLQVVDISKLSEKEKISFFLNVYHIMVLHGIIVLGPPLAWVNWQSFFNSVTYIIDADIVSIAELEQNILRASMSKSSMLFSKTIAPQSSFPLFALRQRDFRLNFCINNGSASMASCVPIYKAETLDKQLDEMTSFMLSETVEVDSRKRVITLPKICSAYLKDFSTAKSTRFASNVSPLDCVRILASYLNTDDKRAVVKLLSDGHNPSVKFKSFNFSCRRFELYQPSINEDN